MERLRARSWHWAPPLVALLLFAAVGISGSDKRLFLALNHAGAALGTTFWVNLTMLGDGAVVLALVLPCIRRSPRCFWAALAAALIATLWVQVFKHVSHVPRPLAVFGPGRFHLAGPGYRAVSFPSGHATAIFTLVGIWVMGLAPPTLVRLLLLVLAAFVSLSRVMVGVHWPLDILWGMLGGWLSAMAGLALSARLGWRTSGAAGFAAGCVLLVLAAALIFSDHIGIPAVLPMQRALGLVCLVWGGAEMLRMLPRRQRRRWRRGWRYRRGGAISRGRSQDSRESGNTIHD